MFTDKDAHILKNGGIGIIPTDTIYGMVTSALQTESIERLYNLKGRSPDKPCIILIAEISDLHNFPVHLNTYQEEFCTKHWPSPLSIILPLSGKVSHQLDRGTGSLSFRIPDNKELRDFLQKTGPLIAPSANTQGNPPARNIADARKYFPQGIDVFIDGGPSRQNQPSTLVRLLENDYEILRQGAYIFNS